MESNAVGGKYIAERGKKIMRERMPPRTWPPNPTLKANREWLAANRDAYRGQWIALRNGELLATGASMEEVERQITHVPRRVDGHLQVLMTRA